MKGAPLVGFFAAVAVAAATAPVAVDAEANQVGSISYANPTLGANFANPNYNHPMPIQRLEEEIRLINT
jgi:hypothetical protein